MTKQQRQAAYKQKLHRSMTGKTLQVYPNPYGCAPHCTLDKMGRAAGRPPTDPTEDGSTRKWVGVRTDRLRTVFMQDLMRGDDLRSRRQETVLSYLGISAQELTPGALVKKDPAKVPRTRFYEQLVRAGTLIAADKETAHSCATKFENVLDVLKMRESDARSRFDAQYGEGAFKLRKEQRDADEKHRKAAAKKAAGEDKTQADTSA